MAEFLVPSVPSLEPRLNQAEPSKLEQLPAETLGQICEIVAADHVQSVPAFACASKKCYAAALPWLYHDFKLELPDLPEVLDAFVQWWTDRLRSENAFKHIRRLALTGHIGTWDFVIDGEPPHPVSCPPHLRPLRTAPLGPPCSLETLDCHLFPDPWCAYDGWGSFMPDVSHPAGCDKLKPPFGYENEAAWDSLARFIAELPGLTDLIFYTSYQFPPSLLRALHEHAPRCRLHLADLRLFSLHEPEMDRHELALMSSPSLCTARFRIPGGGELLPGEFFPFLHALDNPHGYELATTAGIRSRSRRELASIMRLVAHNTPNLRHLWMSHKETQVPVFSRHQPWLTGHGSWLGPTPDGRGFAPNGSGDYSLAQSLDGSRSLGPGSESSSEASSAASSALRSGSLKSLELNDMNKGIFLSPAALRIWSEHVDFSNLQTLKLNLSRLPGLLLTDCNLTGLHTLAIKLPVYSHFSTPPEQLAEAYEEVSGFLRRLKQLRALQVQRWPVIREKVAPPILPSTLRTLRLDNGNSKDKWLMKGLTEHEISEIVEQCPMLEDLAIMVHRQMGNAEEVAAYRTIGRRLPWLRRLSLTLVVMPSDYDERRKEKTRQYDEFHRRAIDCWPGYPRGNVRELFISCALDDTLARSIFAFIASQSGKERLEALKVEITGWKLVNLPDVASVYFHTLCRKWLIKRSPRDDRPHELLATEIEQRERLAEEEESERLYGGRDNPLKAVFRRLWPSSRRSEAEWPVECDVSPGILEEGWRDDWHSWPLAISEASGSG